MCAADPAALLIRSRILRRVIKQDRRLTGFGLRVPHRKSYTIGREPLLEIVDRAELGLAEDAALPENGRAPGSARTATTGRHAGRRPVGRLLATLVPRADTRCVECSRHTPCADRSARRFVSRALLSAHGVCRLHWRLHWRLVAGRGSPADSAAWAGRVRGDPHGARPGGHVVPAAERRLDLCGVCRRVSGVAVFCRKSLDALLSGTGEPGGRGRIDRAGRGRGESVPGDAATRRARPEGPVRLGRIDRLADRGRVA